MSLHFPDKAAEQLGLGRNQFFAWMRQQRLTDAMNRPYQDAIDAGYLVPRRYVKQTPMGPKERIKPMVTDRGLTRFRNLLKEEKANGEKAV
jgi:phage antirepressor YoqD-like protein